MHRSSIIYNSDLEQVTLESDTLEQWITSGISSVTLELNVTANLTESLSGFYLSSYTGTSSLCHHIDRIKWIIM